MHQRVCLCAALIPPPVLPPRPPLSLLSRVSANAEQLDAQVVRPLLLFQVLDFITNSFGGGSNVCVRACACGGVGGGVLSTSVGLFERVDETRVPAELLHGAARLRQETDREKTVSLILFFLNLVHYCYYNLFLFRGGGLNCTINCLVLVVLRKGAKPRKVYFHHQQKAKQ